MRFSASFRGRGALPSSLVLEIRRRRFAASRGGGRGFELGSLFSFRVRSHLLPLVPLVRAREFHCFGFLHQRVPASVFGIGGALKPSAPAVLNCKHKRVHEFVKRLN